jgi:hypothetical protein
MADNYSSTNNGAGVFSTSLTAKGLNATPLATPVPTSFSFGSGNDTINLAGGNNNIFLGEGNNAAFTGKGNDTIYGGAGRDIISAGDGNNIVYAGEGVNLVTSGKGNDLIYTGAAGDFINAGDGRNTIFAGEGDNVILSGKGNDLVFAGAGNDRIFTGDGDDTIYAGNGKNIINAGIGNDKVFLGSGVDKLILESGKGFVTVVGFDITSDKLRLGESLAGQALRFVIQGNDTLVRTSGNADTKLAVLVGVKINSQSIVDRGTLYKYVATEITSPVTDPTKLRSVNGASINDFGQVAGTLNQGDTYQTTANIAAGTATGRRDAFIWEAGVTQVLTNAGLKVGNSATGAADGATGVIMQTPNVAKINNLGVVIGTHDEVRTPVGTATDRGLRWINDGTGYKLSINAANVSSTAAPSKETYFFDINNINQIAGRMISDTNPTVNTPFTNYVNGSALGLSTVGGAGTARGINDKGTLVGVDDKNNIGLVWTKNSSGGYNVSSLLPEGFDSSTLRDINEAGTIIGQVTSGTGTAAISYSIVSRNGVTTILEGLSGGNGSSTPNGINELEQVVGASNGRAFINYGGSAAIDLNTLLTAPLPTGGGGAAFALSSAVSINNFGSIVATGTYANPAVTVANGGSATGATTTRTFALTATW